MDTVGITDVKGILALPCCGNPTPPTLRWDQVAMGTERRRAETTRAKWVPVPSFCLLLSPCYCDSTVEAGVACGCLLESPHALVEPVSVSWFVSCLQSFYGV